jgi:heme/copper-type cytochrome/quinol oxidase subunit 4
MPNQSRESHANDLAPFMLMKASSPFANLLMKGQQIAVAQIGVHLHYFLLPWTTSENTRSR